MSVVMVSEDSTVEMTSSYTYNEQNVFSGSSNILQETLDLVLSICTDEPAKLKELNDRFAEHIEKFHYLMRENHSLQVEVKHLKDHETKRISSLYDEQIRKMSLEMENLARQKAEVEEKLVELTIRLERETKLRIEAEGRITALLKDGNAPTVAALEQKIKILEEQISLMNKIKEENKDEFYWKKIIKEVIDTTKAPSIDVSVILKKIREDISVITNGNVHEIEVLFKSQIADLRKMVSEKEEELIKARLNIRDSNLQIQKSTCEISALRARIEGLNNQISRMVEAHKLEVEGLWRTIKDLEEQVTFKNNQMMYYVHKFNGLHDARAAINVEIAAYKHLLEFEEGRFKPCGTSNFSQRTHTHTTVVSMETLHSEVIEEMDANFNKELSAQDEETDFKSTDQETDEDKNKGATFPDGSSAKDGKSED